MGYQGAHIISHFLWQIIASSLYKGEKKGEKRRKWKKNLIFSQVFLKLGNLMWVLLTAKQYILGQAPIDNSEGLTFKFLNQERETTNSNTPSTDFRIPYLFLCSSQTFLEMRPSFLPVSLLVLFIFLSSVQGMPRNLGNNRDHVSALPLHIIKL